MVDPHLFVRAPGSEAWHWHPGCAHYPVGRNLERHFGWPNDGIPCAWCGSRGSGKPDLDERAHTVLSVLRADGRLRELGVRAERVAWQYGDARFLFSGLSRTQSPVISRAALRESHAVEIADSICRWAAREEDTRRKYGRSAGI